MINYILGYRHKLYPEHSLAHLLLPQVPPLTLPPFPFPLRSTTPLPINTNLIRMLTLLDGSKRGTSFYRQEFTHTLTLLLINLTKKLEKLYLLRAVTKRPLLIKQDWNFIFYCIFQIITLAFRHFVLIQSAQAYMYMCITPQFMHCTFHVFILIKLLKTDMYTCTSVNMGNP